MSKMQAMQVNNAKEFALIEQELPQPGNNEVRVRIKACGVCHSDVFTKEGLWPGIQYPRVPGHEVAGVIDAVGANVTHWKKGQRVGIGWAGKHCGECTPCRRGDFGTCQNHEVTGIHFDGGYAQYMIAPVAALAAIPDELSDEEAAPLLCAGITTFNALRNSGARPGDVVAIQGIGGLGHLAIQFANKMGFKTVAISNGAEKEALAKQLGAHIYIDTSNKDVVTELQKLGGAQVILATAPSGKAISSLIDGLGYKGHMMIVGAAPDPFEVSALSLIAAKRIISGWPSGSAIDSEDTLKFCVLTGIRPMIETFPLKDAKLAYEKMMQNKVKFRSVLLCD